MTRRLPRGNRLLLAALAAALLSGCSSPPEQAEILVNTTPPGAFCTLSRHGQPVATAGPTPALALVDPSGGDLAVTCRRDGFTDATATLRLSSSWLDLSALMPGAVAAADQHSVAIALVPKPPEAARR